MILASNILITQMLLTSNVFTTQILLTSNVFTMPILRRGIRGRGREAEEARGRLVGR